MYPILFQRGPVTIYSFGFFLCLAFLIASFLILRETKRENLEEEKVFDVLLLSLILALFFARFFYILLNFTQFGLNPFNWILVNALPGFYFYGGFWAGVLFLKIFSSKFKLEFKRIVDIFAYGLIVALILISVGSFFSGSDMGTKTNLFWGVYLVGAEGKRHPLAIYNLLFLILALALYFKVKKVYYEKNIVPGTLGLIFITIFGFSQFVLEFFREYKVYLRGINLNQTISFFAFIIGSILLYKTGDYSLNDLKLTLNKTMAKFFKKEKKSD